MGPAGLVGAAVVVTCLVIAIGAEWWKRRHQEVRANEAEVTIDAMQVELAAKRLEINELKNELSLAHREMLRLQDQISALRMKYNLD